MSKNKGIISILATLAIGLIAVAVVATVGYLSYKFVQKNLRFGFSTTPAGGYRSGANEEEIPVHTPVPGGETSVDSTKHYYMGPISKEGCLKNFPEADKVNEDFNSMYVDVGQKMSMSVFGNNKIYHECISNSSEDQGGLTVCTGEKVVLNGENIYSSEIGVLDGTQDSIPPLYLIDKSYLFQPWFGGGDYLLNSHTIKYNEEKDCFLNTTGALCPDGFYIEPLFENRSFKQNMLKVVNHTGNDDLLSNSSLYLGTYNPLTGILMSEKKISDNAYNFAKIFGDHIVYTIKKDTEYGPIFSINYDGKIIGTNRFNEAEIFGDHLAFITDCEKSECDGSMVSKYLFYDGKYYDAAKITGGSVYNTEITNFSIFDDHVGLIAYDSDSETSYLVYDFKVKFKAKGDRYGNDCGNSGCGLSLVKLSKNDSLAYILDGVVYVNGVRTGLDYFHYMYEDFVGSSKSSWVENDPSALSIRSCIQSYIETEVKTSPYGSVKF